MLIRKWHIKKSPYEKVLTHFGVIIIVVVGVKTVDTKDTYGCCISYLHTSAYKSLSTGLLLERRNKEDFRLLPSPSCNQPASKLHFYCYVEILTSYGQIKKTYQCHLWVDLYVYRSHSWHVKFASLVSSLMVVQTIKITTNAWDSARWITLTGAASGWMQLPALPVPSS